MLNRETEELSKRTNQYIHSLSSQEDELEVLYQALLKRNRVLGAIKSNQFMKTAELEEKKKELEEVKRGMAVGAPTEVEIEKTNLKKQVSQAKERVHTLKEEQHQLQCQILALEQKISLFKVNNAIPGKENEDLRFKMEFLKKSTSIENMEVTQHTVSLTLRHPVHHDTLQFKFNSTDQPFAVANKFWSNLK
eukprot:TRINITY_DN1868_c0_g1_i1.p1 TRINITY_DN1868_c0_g1~~TRINITY_DN1868_c0_g1_i1.p1  ORF type:complete len:192 (-),score=59.55 TRINITY_DN1868_c0_g1_i1:112-687(-)